MSTKSRRRVYWRSAQVVKGFSVWQVQTVNSWDAVFHKRIIHHKIKEIEQDMQLQAKNGAVVIQMLVWIGSIKQIADKISWQARQWGDSERQKLSRIMQRKLIEQCQDLGMQWVDGFQNNWCKKHAQDVCKTAKNDNNPWHMHTCAWCQMGVTRIQLFISNISPLVHYFTCIYMCVCL